MGGLRNDKLMHRLRNHRTLSTGQAAKVLDVASRTVIGLLDAGKIRSWRIEGTGSSKPGDRRMLLEDLVAYMVRIGVPSRMLDHADVFTKVLAVSSDAALCLVLEQGLAVKDGWAVRAASCPVAVGAMLVTARVDVAVLDCRMGTQDVGAIRRHLQDRCVPPVPYVLLLSDDGGDEQAMAGSAKTLRSGCDPRAVVEAVASLRS